MTSGPLVELTEEQWLGVHDAAQANDCDLVCFVGRELGHPDSLLSKANAVYDLIATDQLDALVVWTTRIGLLMADLDLEDFLRRYEPLPVIGVEHQVADWPAVLMDNRSGMAEAVDHLIKVHGHRRIAFLRGPDNHAGAQDRFAGYRDALRRNGLPYDPRLVTPPGAWNWSPDSAAEAVTELLDRAATPPEAVAAANDDFALAVLAVLDRKGIRTPDDMGVIGFDNHVNTLNLGYEVFATDLPGAPVQHRVSVNAGTLELTTVRAPFHEMGWRAVALALAKIRGQAVPSITVMPTELVVRRSCGCFSATYGSATPAGPERTALERDTRPDAVAADMRRMLGEHARVLPDGWAQRLVAGFFDEVAGRVKGTFLPTLAGYVRATVRVGSEPADWWRALYGLRRRTAGAESVTFARTEDLWSRVDLLLAETTQRLADYRHVLDGKRDQAAREAGQRVIASRGVGELTVALVEDLPKLGIPGCHISVYETVDVFDEPDPPPATDEPLGRSRLVFAYEDGRQRTDTGPTVPFQSALLTPYEIDRPAPYSIVAASLYTVDGQLGFILFEVGPRAGWVYEAMQRQVSGALSGMLLLQRERRAVAARADSSRRLELAHAELERRVRERTAELALANRILTDQIAERELAERRQADLENQLRHGQKMEAIGRLAGGVAHDFNNLLTVINGNSDFLLHGMDDKDPCRPEVEDIQYAGEHAANLINQLLAFARQTVSRPDRLDLNQAVDNVQTMLRRLIGEDIELRAVLPADVAPVWADAGQVEQIIFNLAANARDAMPNGGVLSIETGNVHLDGAHPGRLVDVRPGEYVMLRVRDTGVGMDEAVQANVFEPFFTTKPAGQGTGLGLATVFGIVQHSGGQLNLTSAPGEGTTIDIYLPRAPSDAVVTSAQPRHGALHGGSVTILLVEDNRQVRSVIRRYLAQQGYQVLMAGDGQDALRVARDHAGPIDLVVTDVVMPRMGGPQFVNQLAEIRPPGPVLYISGYTDGYVEHERLTGATVALLRKPFTEDSLLERVRALLDLAG